MAHDYLPQTWHSIRLFPSKGVSLEPESCYVMDPTPFTQFVYCMRSFTECKTSCLFDIHMNCERRVKTSYPGVLPRRHDLRDGMPFKVLSYD